MIPTAIIAYKRNYPKQEGYGWRKTLKLARDAFFGLFTIIIIMGGVISGVFTATESAAVAAVYSFIVTFFIYREIPLKQMNSILRNSLKTLAMVMSLIAAASSFGYLMAFLRIPQAVTNGLLTITDNRVLLILLVNLMLLVLGAIMDMAPLIIITTPILFPVMVGYLGMDPIQFGIMLILNLAIGLTTPPVGSALFVGCSIGKLSIEEATKAIVPFWIMMLIMLMLVSFWSPVSMFLPSLMG
jgi:tripartite ATP-independent transporter DctM subunit